jgi:SAM-dependent methyltransferase
MTMRRLAASLAVITIAAGIGAATPLGRDLLFHVVPVNWTGEGERLAAATGLGPGGVVADIGAGDGALIVELSRTVGPAGAAFATERAPEQRRRIMERADAAGVRVSVVEAGERSTNLADACCDAIVMRMVMHHISDPAAFAKDIRRSLRPGGRVAIVDFAPGVMPHLSADHGLEQSAVLARFTDAGLALLRRDENWGGRTYLLVFGNQESGTR